MKANERTNIRNNRTDREIYHINTLTINIYGLKG